MHNGRLRRDRRDGGAPQKRVSYASVAATLALVLAIGGGTAWAAHHYPITSTSQIKPSVLKKLHGANGTNGTNGTNGKNGKNGATGATGVNGTASVLEELATGTIPANSIGLGHVSCPPGTKATGGGGYDGNVSTAWIYQEGPLPVVSYSRAVPTGWEVFWKTNADPITWGVYAICVSPLP